jgi:symplekin
MDSMIREFALQMLRKLQSQPAASQPEAGMVVDGDGDGDVDGKTGSIHAPDKMTDTAVENPRAELEQDENMEDGQIPPEALVHTPYLPERIELPAKKPQVLQHVELLFALSVKVPEFLDEYVVHAPLLVFRIFVFF